MSEDEHETLTSRVGGVDRGARRAQAAENAFMRIRLRLIEG